MPCVSSQLADVDVADLWEMFICGELSDFGRILLWFVFPFPLKGAFRSDALCCSAIPKTTKKTTTHHQIY